MEYNKHDSSSSAKQEETTSSEIDEAEKSKIRIMRAIVEREDPPSKEIDDYMLRRFLHARDLDAEKAANMFLKYLKWRRSFIPNGYISASEIIDQLAQNKVFMQGHDKQSQPVVVVFGSRHVPTTKETLLDFKRLAVYSLDKICARLPHGKEKYTCICDLEGWGYSCNDNRAYMEFLSILQNYYPERLGKFFIVHVPYIFKIVWKMIYPFIDKNTKKNVFA